MKKLTQAQFSYGPPKFNEYIDSPKRTPYFEAGDTLVPKHHFLSIYVYG